MDKSFWQERWERRDIGFHQQQVNEQLSRFWPSLGLAPGSTVFVPLAGKSRDMIWLAMQGHYVIGVELSDIAVREFFQEGGQVPARTKEGKFEIYSVGPFKLYCGDFFDLSSEALGNVAAVYDRAALIALPPAARAKYAKMLAATIPRTAPIFVVAIDYPENEISGPPFAVTRADIERLFAEDFTIELLATRDGLAASDNLKKRGVTRLEETTYLLRRRP